MDQSEHTDYQHLFVLLIKTMSFLSFFYKCLPRMASLILMNCYPSEVLPYLPNTYKGAYVTSMDPTQFDSKLNALTARPQIYEFDYLETCNQWYSKYQDYSKFQKYYPSGSPLDSSPIFVFWYSNNLRS